MDTLHFYKEHIQLTSVFENDWFVEFQLTGTSFLSIANAARTSIQDVGGQGITLTWKVENIEQVKKLLGKRGVSTTPIKDKWGALVMYCFDPEGHRLEFWSDIEGKQDIPCE